MDPKVFAQKAMNLIGRNLPVVIVPGWPWKFGWFINRLFPSLGLYLSRKKNEANLRMLHKELASRADPTTESDTKEEEEVVVENKPPEEAASSA